jgi:uncharacterized protein HemX
MNQRSAIVQRTVAAALLCALGALVVPSAPARADGAASTRNIILGGALAAGTLLIVNHNKKVHQKEDELTNARNQAEAERDAEATSAASMHRQLVAESRELAALKREVGMQHNMIMELRKQVSSSDSPTAGTVKTAFIEPLPPNAPQIPAERLASVSYGWGQL